MKKMKVVITKSETPKSVQLTALYNGSPIKTYHFESKEEGTELGAKIVTGAMAGWVTTDLCLAEEIILDMSLPREGQDFVQGLYELVTNFYRSLWKREFAELFFRKPEDSFMSGTSLDTNITFLGKSGGKDSNLVDIVLQMEGKQHIVPYKISYEQNGGDGEFTIYEREISPTICEKIVPLRAFPQQGEFVVLEPTDIGLTFLAPYFNVKKGFPSTVAIGLQWDSRWVFPEIASTLVPTESPAAIELYTQFMRSMNLNWSPEFPIYSIHTNGVYRALENLLGQKKVDSMVSCWNSNEYNCGSCPKCQRVKYVTKKALGRDVLPQIPLIDMNPILIYGSINAAEALTKYTQYSWDRVIVVHNDKLERDAHRNILGDILNAVEVPATSLHFEFTLPKIPKGYTAQQIANAIGIHYKDLKDEPCNTLKVPTLPFEKYFSWGRQHKILNCYGFWPVIKDGRLSLVQVSKGGKLSLPRTSIFEQFFSYKKITEVFK